jgi:uncharacterized protein YcnI
MAGRLIAVALVAVLAGLFASSAHGVLEVRPSRVAVDSEVDFVLRVHSVRSGTETRAVKVHFPEDLTGVAIGAPPLGWSMRPIESDGRAVGVRYLGGAIPEGTHQDFVVRARTAVAGRSLWTAEQFYANGDVVDFALEPGQAAGGDEGFAAVVEIRGPGAGATPSTPADPTAPREPASGEPFTVVPEADSEEGLGVLQWLGLALLLIALAAFVAARVLLWTDPDDATGRPA